MADKLKQSILKSIFSLKGNFAPGLAIAERRFDGVEITPFLGGAGAAATISADFEIAWAFRGRSVEERTLRATRCRNNVPFLVRILEEESIPITWATVGHLFLEQCERDPCGQAHADMPRPPKNERWEGDWYRHDPCTSLAQDPAWYAPDLIRGILGSQVKHEIGSHSFSHIDFSVATSTRELVRREMEQCIRVMKPWGLRLRSLVYPFNNMGHHYMDLLADLNITSVRHRDSRVRLSYPERSPAGVYKLYESMNMRKGNHYDYLDKAKIFLEQAMKRHAAYHLWFHPSDPTEVFENEFRNIIRHLRDLRDQGRLWPVTMGGLTAYCEAREQTELGVERDSGSIRISVKTRYDVSRFGETALTLRVPLARSPKQAVARTGKDVVPISGRLEAEGNGGTRAYLFDVPITAKDVEVAI